MTPWGRPQTTDSRSRLPMDAISSFLPCYNHCEVVEQRGLHMGFSRKGASWLATQALACQTALQTAKELHVM